MPETLPFVLLHWKLCWALHPEVLPEILSLPETLAALAFQLRCSQGHMSVLRLRCPCYLLQGHPRAEICGSYGPGSTGAEHPLLKVVL